MQRGTELEGEVQDLSARYDEQSKTIQKLNEQLEDLIQSKKTHENALLEKFRELLNTKKLKIRDQQRLLAGAKVDPKQAARFQSARETTKEHTAKASRAGKRKADVKADESESEEGSFERRVPAEKQDDELSEQVNTPEASDQDVTEDESNDDLEPALREAKLSNTSKNGGDDGKLNKIQLDRPPPARELPFGKADIGGGREQVKPPVEDRSTLNQEAGNEDEETDDDDDEL